VYFDALCVCEYSLIHNSWQYLGHNAKRHLQHSTCVSHLHKYWYHCRNIYIPKLIFSLTSHILCTHFHLPWKWRIFSQTMLLSLKQNLETTVSSCGNTAPALYSLQQNEHPQYSRSTRSEVLRALLLNIKVFKDVIRFTSWHGIISQKTWIIIITISCNSYSLVITFLPAFFFFLISFFKNKVIIRVYQSLSSWSVKPCHKHWPTVSYI